MRTSEERILELHRRMGAMEEAKNRRAVLIKCAAAMAACLVIAVLISVLIAGAPVMTAEEAAGGAAASIFAGQKALGYVVTAILAFLLGALVTVLCFRIKRHGEENKKRDDR